MILRMIQKKPSLINRVKQVKGQPITNAHFAMVELHALEGLSGLVRSHPKAAELMLMLIRQMPPGSGGVVVCSRETMAEMLGCSLPTIYRALNVLIDDGWVQRMRVGSAHALAVNHQVAWVGPRGDIQHAVFSATVIASRTEQDEKGLNPPPLRSVPILSPGEVGLPVGPGETPPSQPGLGGIDGPAFVTGDAAERAALEVRGQMRIDQDTGEIL